MKKTSTQWTGLLALLGMAIALNACGDAENRTDQDKEVQPVIEAKIGDTWDEVARHSTYDVGPFHFGGGGTIIDKPHTFVYRDPHHYMQLDDVRYINVFISSYHNTIQSFGIGPYQESANTDKTWQRLQNIVHKMEQAGWIPDDARNKRNPSTESAAALRSLYINLPGGAAGDEKYWYDEYGNEAWVRLVKTITGRPPGQEPTFNIVLQIQVATHPRKQKTKL